MDEKQFKIICKKLDSLLMAAALKEEKRENKVKILKRAGMKQTDILDIVGVSEVTKRTRKHRAKKK